MAATKGRSQGGSGGRCGHAGMDHACKTEEAKDAARIVRRVESKRLVFVELIENDETSSRFAHSRYGDGAGSRKIEIVPVVETELRAREVRLPVIIIEPAPDP